MTYAYLPYELTEVYCLIIGLTILFSVNSNLGSEHEVKQLRYMIYSYITMLASDILWALMEDSVIILPVYLNAFINAVTLISVTSGCYFWFRFIEDRTHFSLSAHQKLDTIVALPMIIIAIADLISIFTQWLFYIDADGHFENSDLFVLQSIVNYSYLVIPTILSLVKASKSKLSSEKAEYFTYSLYMTAPLITSIFEDTLNYVPLLALNILMIIIIMFMKIQNLRISNDALTGLNNRRRLNSFLSEKLSKVSAANPLLIFIMDINDFKSINDQYGHVEGDYALKLFSSALKSVASECFAFAARYGGDEFCLVMNQSGRTSEEIENKINKTLAALQENEKKYTVTVSIGCAFCTQADETPESVLRRADKMLYESKNQWHDQND